MSTHTQHRRQDGQVQHGPVWLEPVVLFAMCQLGRSGPTLKATINYRGMMTTTLQSEGDCYPPLPPKTTSAPRHVNMPNEPVDTATCVARRNFTMSNILHCAYRLPRHDVRAHIDLPGPRNAGRRQGNGPMRLGHIGMAKEAPIWWRVGRNDGKVAIPMATCYEYMCLR